MKYVHPLLIDEFIQGLVIQGNKQYFPTVVIIIKPIKYRHAECLALLPCHNNSAFPLNF